MRALNQRVWMYTLLLVSSVATQAWATVPVPLNQRGLPTLSPLLKEVTAAVVNISVMSKVQTTQNPLFNDPFFRRFFDLPERAPVQPRMSAGSGVIIDAEKGYVLTNHHVVEGADEVRVTLKVRRTFEAKRIGSDPATDIALLQIEAEGLTALEFGDSDILEVGDFVVAIGNPFGLGQTVTSGIVSALGRSGINLEGYEDFIQTDAPINPGNSGGALVTLDGNLAGINTAIIAPGGGNVGIGFAVPANMAKAVMGQLIEYGEVRRGRLGVYIQDITPDLAEALGSKSVRGALVTQVEPKSSAERSGIKPGDIIIRVNDQDIRTSTELRNTIGLIPAGQMIQVTLLRDEQSVTVDIELSADAREAAKIALAERLAGAVLQDIDPRTRGAMEGVLVADVERDSPAWNKGLRPGDVIVSVNRRPVKSVEELRGALEDARQTIALRIVRGNAALYLVIR